MSSYQSVDRTDRSRVRVDRVVRFAIGCAGMVAVIAYAAGASNDVAWKTSMVALAAGVLAAATLPRRIRRAHIRLLRRLGRLP